MSTTPSRDDIPIAFESRGTGSPELVFVHGWSCDRTYWQGQVDFFARRHRVVTIDLAGHGESGGGREAWTMRSFGDDVVAVVDRLGLRQAVLIGHSMGGDVIVEAALELPGRVVGLVWVDVYNSLGNPRTPGQIEAFVAPLREDFAANARPLVRGMFLADSDPALVERVAEDMASAPADVAVGAGLHAMSNDRAILERLPRLTSPLVAINPGHRPTDVESLRRHGVRTVLMTGVAHFLMMEDPKRFNRVLAGVIAEFRVGPAS